MSFFQNAHQALSGLACLTPDYIDALEKLTFASEYIYIDINRIFPVICKRGEFLLFADLVYAASLHGHEYGNVILAHYSRFTFPLKNMDGYIRSFIYNISGKVKKAGTVLSFCLSFRNPGISLFFLKHMGYIAAFSPGSIMAILKCISRNLRIYSWPALSKWIIRGTDLLTSNRVDEGVRFLLMRSRESRWLLGINNVVLDDLKNILKIYCASLAGKEMIIAGLDASGFRFSSPYTDGKTIFLPQEIDFFDNPGCNERAFTVLAAQQAASVRLKTFEFDLKKITFEDELHDRYGTQLPRIMENVKRQYSEIAENIRERPDGEIEVTFKGGRKLLVLNTDHEKFYYSFPTPEFARDLFILLENERIEYHLSKLYPGLKEDFKLVKEYLFSKRPHIAPPGTDRQVQFLATVECLVQYSLGERYKGKLNNDRLEQIIAEICRTFTHIHQDNTSVHDTAHICFLLYNIFHDNFPVITYFTDNNLENTFSSMAQPDIHSEVVLDVSPDLLKEEAEAPPPGPGQEEGNDDPKSIDLTSIRNADKESDYVQDLIAKGGLRIFRYPEYNTIKNSYEDNYCTLFERVLEPVQSDYYSMVLHQYRVEYKKIKKRFLLMKPEETEISRRWESGEEIHMTDAFDYMVDMYRHTTPDDKIYFRKILNKRDIAVAILVDTSSSTLADIGAKKIIDVEKEALCLLASALAIIGDTFGIFSFFSMGRNRVFFNIVKDFYEEWNNTSRGRIPHMTGKSSNRDGCAIRHTISRLAELPHKTKLFILLSDGIPADLNYGSTSSGETNIYAIEDTRRAIIEARRTGIIPYCITIDRYARKYIPHLYGDFSYAVIDDVTQLPRKLSQLYIRLTR